MRISILFGVASFGLISNSIAADWRMIIDDPRVTLEIDSSSIRKNANQFEATFRFNHSENQKSANGATYASSEVTSLFNCEERKYAPYKRIEFEGHKSTGAEVNHVLRVGSEIGFYDPAPGSMGKYMYASVCK